MSNQKQLQKYGNGGRSQPAAHTSWSHGDQAPIVSHSTKAMVNSPTFSAFPFFSGPQNKIVVTVGNYAIGQEDDVTCLESITLVTPQQEVHSRRLIRHQRKACPVLAFLSYSPFVEKYEFGVYVALCRWYDAFWRLHMLFSFSDWQR